MRPHQQTEHKDIRTAIVAGPVGLLTVVSVLLAVRVPSRFGHSNHSEQVLSLVLGLSLAIIFLATPRRVEPADQARQDSFRHLNWTRVTTGLGLLIYTAIAYPGLVGRAMSLSPDALIVVGVYAISAAFSGWWPGQAPTWQRGLIALPAIVLLLPPDATGAVSLWIQCAGLLTLILCWIGTPTPSTKPMDQAT